MIDSTEAIGFVAAALSTIAFLPQAYKAFRTKHTKDISLWMYILVNLSTIFWLTYGIVIGKWPIIAANVVTILFVVPTLFMKIFEKKD